MSTKRIRWLGLVLTLTTSVALLTSGSAFAVPVGTPKTGMVCSPGIVSGTTHTFNLSTGTGYMQTPDGNSVFMWSYADANDPDPNLAVFQTPGPTLCVTQGETVVINLTNTLPEATSIVFPGQDAQINFSGGTPGLLTTEAAASGGTVSYSFLAGSPGTYLYESGSDISKQIEMGLFGALIVRPSANAGYAYDATTAFDTSREYLLLLSEVDSDLHHAIEIGAPYDFNALHNRYYAVNGRQFPDTLQENGSGLLPSQPYGALVRIQPTSPSSQPALIRMINVGALNHPFHPHGNHFRQIAQDGRLLLDGAGSSASTERFGETIGSGQTQDYLVRWDDPDHWNPVTNPLPVAQPSFLNLVFKDGNTWYSGNPYLGYKGTLPTGTNSLNVCGEWYFPMHSHALNEFANFDEPFGGMATMLRVDPPGGCFTAPSATTILAGTLSGGTVSALSAVDTNYYSVNSTTTGTRTTDWYAQFSGVASGATNLNVTYVGNNSFAPSAQNFNTLASTGATGTVLPTGWAFSESGGGSNGSYGVNNGSSGTANTYSYGATGSTDRAFGTLRGTGSLASIIGAAFTNNTGAAITSLKISYTGEQWRYGGGGPTADHLDFSYSTNATNLTNGTWTAVSALNFNSPVTTGAARALDGNASANRTAVSFTITGLSIPNGATYRIRWTDFDRAGSGDDGLAVDDFSITPAGSATMATTLSIWNWVTSTWSQFGGPTPIGATDVTMGPLAVPGPWTSYIGTGPNSGRVRIRVLTTGGTTNFVTNANFMSLVYDAP